MAGQHIKRHPFRIGGANAAINSCEVLEFQYEQILILTGLEALILPYLGSVVDSLMFEFMDCWCPNGPIPGTKVAISSGDTT